MHGNEMDRFPGVVSLPVIAGLASGLAALLSVGGVANAEPDVIVSEISSAGTWTGETGINGKRCYTFGAGFCNLGWTPAVWQAGTTNTTAVTHGVFRLSGGRFEQIGVSWVSVEREVSSYNICATCQSTPPGALGVGCGTESFAPFTASWTNLISRRDVNPSAGQILALPPTNFVGPDVFSRRIPIREADIQGQPQGTMFFVEAQAIHPADASAGLSDNNHSYRRIDFVQADLHVLFRSSAYEERPVIYAWKDHGRGPSQSDPDVRISEILVPGAGGGKFLVGSKATAVAGGRWRYDYAVQNMNCDRAARAFRVPLGVAAGAANLYFHDVDYHSGDPFAATNWDAQTLGMEVGWSTQQYTTNANANALRWGTVYTYSFTSSTPPSLGQATLELFRPGEPGTLSDMSFAPASVWAPSAAACPGDANGDRSVDFFDLIAVLDGWSATGAPGWRPGDVNRDGAINTLDLNLVLSYFSTEC